MSLDESGRESSGADDEDGGGVGPAEGGRGEGAGGCGALLGEPAAVVEQPLGCTGGGVDQQQAPRGRAAREASGRNLDHDPVAVEDVGALDVQFAVRGHPDLDDGRLDDAT